VSRPATVSLPRGRKRYLVGHNREMSSRATSAAPSLRIGQYWDREVAPDDVEELFATFRAQNPDFEHEVFSEAGAERFIAEHFSPREVAAFRACGVPAMQADYFRYCLVLVRGGIYADADYRCVASLRPLLEESVGGELFLGFNEHRLKGREANRVWNGFFAFRQPGHPFLRLALEIATANLEARIAEKAWPAGDNVRAAIWLTVGPGILTSMRLIHAWGSFDAYLEAIVGTEAEPFGELYCETIGDLDRLAAAFEGVRISPFDRMLRWIAPVPVDDLAYKATETHWHNVETAIFR
jgi:hypothetical protein